MQPLSFLSNSRGTTLTSTPPLPKTLEKQPENESFPDFPEGRVIVVGHIPPFGIFIKHLLVET